jgi:hypothetical protein
MGEQLSATNIMLPVAVIFPMTQQQSRDNEKKR